MHILIVDDRGSVSYYLTEELISAGHTVFEANDINDAQSYWEDETIDCIIADLNMNPVGLKPDEVPETHNGVLTGWVWLKYYVYPKQPELRTRTIIHSVYCQELREAVHARDLLGIRIVCKTDSDSWQKIRTHVTAIDKRFREDLK